MVREKKTSNSASFRGFAFMRNMHLLPKIDGTNFKKKKNVKLSSL